MQEQLFKEQSLDPKIEKLVVALNENKIATTSSCEGHLDKEVPFPWVALFIPDDPPFSEFVRKLMLFNRESEVCWVFEPHLTHQGIPILILRPNDMNEAEDPEVLRKAQESAEALATFLDSSHYTSGANRSFQ